MAVGFIGADVALLSLFKETVQKFPLHDFVIYIDTQKELKENELRKGVDWLLGKDVDVIAAAEKITLEEVRKLLPLQQIF